MVKNENHNHGIGFTGLLTVVLIALKLCGVIDWSWWWVFAPAITATVVGLIVVIVCIIVQIRSK